MDDYIAQARQTLSPAWHGDLVDREYFEGLLERAILVANEMDAVKKALFYGRMPDAHFDVKGKYPRQMTPLTEQFICDRMGDGNADPRNIVHAIVGQFTESGELLEALHDAMFGTLEGLDPINLREEVGDSLWYQSILLHECGKDGDGYTFEDAMHIDRKSVV